MIIILIEAGCIIGHTLDQCEAGKWAGKSATRSLMQSSEMFATSQQVDSDIEFIYHDEQGVN